MIICISSKIRKLAKPSIFLGGLCEDGNKWREEIKKEFKGDFIFLDPYDKNWDPEENIYKELTDIYNADRVIFYKGGEGTKKEKKFMENIDKKYESFKSLDELKDKIRTYLKRK